MGEEGKTCKDVPAAPKCVEQGNKCTYNQKCCGDNLICSADGFGGEMTCKERPPKCSKKGDECSMEQKCCGTMMCAEDKYEERKTCKDVPAEPKCIVKENACYQAPKPVGECCVGLFCCSTTKVCTEGAKCSKKGDKCSYKQKCCDDNLICSADGMGGEATCKERPSKCSKKGDECSMEQKCCGTMMCAEDKY